jgi:ABC-type nitrate/sulfonate/bicarbonate transport system substrate-binding protein
MRVSIISIAALIFFSIGTWVSAADKLRLAYVSPSLTLSLPWVAKETGILAKHDLTAEVVLITGSPRLVQSLIAGDVDVVFAGVTALIRARAWSRSCDPRRRGESFQPKTHGQPQLESAPP